MQNQIENRHDKGFTLVELLIVIVILGILATVTVFAVRGITDKGQENACDVDQRTLDTSIEAFYAQYQRDPLTEAELTEGVLISEATTEPVAAAVYAAPLLKDAPTNFSFEAPGVGTPAAYTFVDGGPCDPDPDA